MGTVRLNKRFIQQLCLNDIADKIWETLNTVYENDSMITSLAYTPKDGYVVFSFFSTSTAETVTLEKTLRGLFLNYDTVCIKAEVKRFDDIDSKLYYAEIRFGYHG